MTVWAVLRLGQDPAPGDPAAVLGTARRYLAHADLLAAAMSRLSSIAAASAELGLIGDYAAGFHAGLDELPGQMARSERAYRRCGQALSAFSAGLEHARNVAGTALQRGTAADLEHTHAVQQLRSLVPAGRQVMVSSGLGLTDFGVDAATLGLSEDLRERIRAAAVRARAAEADREAARVLALQAAQLRGDAESRCAGEINDSLDDIENKHWWQQAWDVATAPFRSWDGFVSFCATGALVLGVVALFFTGPIGWALMAAAAAGGTVLAADGLNRYRKGEIGAGELAVDLLGVLPVAGVSGRAVGMLGRLARATPMTGKVFSVSTGLVSGAGSVVRGAAARAWPAIADSFGRVREQAIPMARRTFGRDPIDVSCGDVVLQQTDLRLPGLLELVLQRTHLSSYRSGRWFGPSWASFLDQRLEIVPGAPDGDPGSVRVLYAASDATVLCFPRAPQPGETITPAEGPRLELAAAPGDSEFGYRLTDPETGLTSWFGRGEQLLGADHPRDQVLVLLAVTDRNGHRIGLSYSSDGTLELVRHSGGYRVRVDTQDNRIVGLRVIPLEQQGSDGTSGGTRVASYHYDDAGRLAEVVNSSGLPLSFRYDSEGRLVRWEDRNGCWYHYTYDGLGRCVRTSGAGGCLAGELIYQHDGSTRTTAEVDSLGQRTTYLLNDLSQVVAVTDPLGNVTTTEWDAFDHRLAVTDAAGATTRFGYDDAFNLTSVQGPDGSVTRISYSGLRLPEVLIQPGGTRWQREYDTRGNLLAFTDPAGARTSIGYDRDGAIATVTGPLGAVTHYSTNAAGLVITATDPAGGETRCVRDEFGRVTSLRDGLGDVTVMTYSPEGWLTRQTSPVSGTTEWEHDGEGNVVREIDSAGHVTTIHWTHFDLPAARIQPDGSQLTYSYDTELRLVAVTDGLGRIWSFEYDAAGRLVRQCDVNGRTLGYQHDAAGRVTRQVNGSAGDVELAYDLAGRLVRKQVGAATTSYEYDALGRMVRAVSPDADLVRHTDPLGRVISETCNGLTSTFSYDLAGQRVGRSTPSHARSSYIYDSAGRLAELSRAGRTLALSHDQLGRETTRALSPAAVLEQTWGAGQLLSQSLHVGDALGAARPASGSAGRRYRYDGRGQLVSVRDRRSGRTDFGLDPLGRVTSARTLAAGTTTATESFGYDRAGSLGSAGPGPGAARSLAGTLTKRAGAWRFAHDSRGRMVLRQHRTLSGRARNWHYTWDAEDRLTSVTTPGGTLWTYRYDGLGRRCAKQRMAADGVTVEEEQRFVWDGAVLAEQITIAGPAGHLSATTWDWHPHDLQPLTQSHRLPDADQGWYDEQFYSIVTDLIGTPAELVDDAGEVRWHRRSSVWGDRPPSEPGDLDCPLAFPGQYRDEETGLHYNLLRYYDPLVGSFVSPDPLGILAGPNPHSYVPNPTTYIDPLGLAPCQLPGSGAAGQAEGSIRARSVHFTQDNIGSHFKDGRSVLDLADTLTTDSARSVPPIRIFEQNGFIHSLDNRRLFAGQYADVDLPFRWARQADIAARRRTELFNGTGIEMRGIGWWQNP